MFNIRVKDVLHSSNLKIDTKLSISMNIDVFYHRQLDLVCGRVSELCVLPKISGLCQKYKLPWNLLEK